MNLRSEGKYEGIMAGRLKLKPTFICNSLKSHWVQTPSHSHLSFFLWAETLGVSRGTEALARPVVSVVLGLLIIIWKSCSTTFTQMEASA